MATFCPDNIDAGEGLVRRGISRRRMAVDVGQTLDDSALGVYPACSSDLEPQVCWSTGYEAVLSSPANTKFFRETLEFKSGIGVQINVWQSTAPQEGDRTMPTPISRDEVLRLMRD